MSVSVCVIGGGAAGLYTALRLQQHGVKDVVVLEARDRVGGRTHSEVMGSGVTEVIDVGGQWVGPTQKRLMDLISRYKLSLREQFEEGKHILEFKNKLFHYAGGISELDLEGNQELAAVWQKLDGMADKIDVAAPWNSCGAVEYDGVTLRNWLQKNTSEDTTRRLVEWFARVCIATEPSEFSLLYFLTWLKSGGLYASLVNIKGGAQNFTVIGGMQQVSDKMRNELGPGVVQLSCVVKKLVRTGAGVTVHFIRNKTSAEEIKARRVVIAMSPPLSAKIECVPGSSFERRQLCGAMEAGKVIKVLVAFKVPFWRNAGLSGEFISDVGPLAVGYDRSNVEQKFYGIVGFVAGATQASFGALSDKERQTLVVDQFARMFKYPNAHSDLLLYKDHNWSKEEFSEGCYFAYMKPSAIIRFKDALTAPVQNRIFYCGTETAREWIGYIEGALESGERVAAEVIKAEKETNSKL